MRIESPEKFSNAERFEVAPEDLPSAGNGPRVNTPWNSFGTYKSERAAGHILKFFQQRKKGWNRFTYKELMQALGFYFPKEDNATRVQDLNYSLIDISELYRLYILPLPLSSPVPPLEELYLDWPLVVSTEFVQRLQRARWPETSLGL